MFPSVAASPEHSARKLSGCDEAPNCSVTVFSDAEDGETMTKSANSPKAPATSCSTPFNQLRSPESCQSATTVTGCGSMAARTVSRKADKPRLYFFNQARNSPISMVESRPTRPLAKNQCVPVRCIVGFPRVVAATARGVQKRPSRKPKRPRVSAETSVTPYPQPRRTDSLWRSGWTGRPAAVNREYPWWSTDRRRLSRLRHSQFSVRSHTSEVSPGSPGDTQNHPVVPTSGGWPRRHGVA